MPRLDLRLRLYALYVALTALTAAYAAVSAFAIRSLQNDHFAAHRPAALAGWLGLSSVPALVLAPLVGVLAGSRWNRPLLVVTPLAATALLYWAAFDPGVPPLSVAGVLALNLAFLTAATVVRLTSLGRQEHVSVSTLSVGIALCLVAAGGFGGFLGTSTDKLPLGLGVALLLTAGFCAVYMREPLSDTVPLARGFVRPFLEGLRESVRQRRARQALIGLGIWSFVAVTSAVILVRLESLVALDRDRAEHTGLLIGDGPDSVSALAVLRFLSACAVGVLVTAIQRHPYRHAGFVLYAAAAALGALLWLRFGDAATGPLVLLGFALGLALSPLLNFYLVWTDPKHHGVAAGLVVAVVCAAALVLAAVLVNLGDDPAAARASLLNILLGITGLSLVGGIAAFFRPALELTLEVFFWPIYRIRAVGPGLDRLPVRGPCLVIGNHAGWFDPLFFAKILPAPVIPMMSSKFYDLPVISWLMRHIIGTIRVPDKTVRHEAPELKEAVAGLDRGECIILFPEAYLRRKEEIPLRRFGRGVWQILNDRPETPLFACWIEGAWGSFVSFRGGPPGKGKRLDFWRPIRIGVLGPIRVDPLTLKDHMATRLSLMQQVSEARRPLGLEPLLLPSLQEAEGEKE
jgi:1-acyl-sn-glycerol-3-phosphate acyltransferase